jgi:hypothetical protein
MIPVTRVVVMEKSFSVPDGSLKQLFALHHLVQERPAIAIHRGSHLVIVTERYAEYYHADILKHLHPLATIIQALGAYSDQLVSEEQNIHKIKCAQLRCSLHKLWWRLRDYTW